MDNFYELLVEPLVSPKRQFVNQLTAVSVPWSLSIGWKVGQCAVFLLSVLGVLFWELITDVLLSS